ncbi:MAG TPA: acyl-CoA dehydrogenase, partial [Acidimicrobiia bacterium]|nr:acyl-CoA dehydrogenase [Acidimicrobiia bacterium]
MAYEITDEQAELRSVVGTFWRDRSTGRACYDGGPAIDRAAWSGLADMGLIALSAPATIGGSGGSLMDETLVAEQAGAHAAAVPVVTPSALGSVLGAIGGTPAKEVLAEATGGGKVLVVALSASLGFSLPFEARSDGPEWFLTGTVDDLVEGAGADGFLVPVRRDGQVSWFVVERAGDGITVVDQPSLDRAQRPAGLTCSGAAATFIGETGGPVLADAFDRAVVLVAAQAVGAASRALELSVDYAKERRQFGRPIGSFQAVKHKLADMLIDLENARSAVYNAAWAVDGDRADRALAVRLAKAVGTENAVKIVHDAIQAHGGIGFTWEYDLHLLLRRVKTAQLVLGSPDGHFDAMGTELFARRAARSAGDGIGAGLSEIVDAAGDRQFLAEFSAWLDEHLPAGWGTPDFRLPKDAEERRAFFVGLQRSMAAGGWVGIHWPEEFGGRNATLAQQVTYHAEMVRRGIPPFPGHRGITIVAPTLIKHGTPDQQARFIGRIRTGDDLWAGGFSEPEAGSDLASLRTRAVIDGDTVTINGQKIWTSSARWCNWIYTLVRTDPGAPKHEGISVVLVPLDSPGITVRPIRQITGSAEFNEVFFDDVVVPVENIVGPVNQGWQVNRTTLSHEHFTLFIGAQARYARSVDTIIGTACARAEEVDAAEAVRLRNRLARQWAISQLLLINGMRNVARVQAGGDPGPEGSIMKVFGQEAEKALFELALDILGPRGVLDRGADGAIDRGKWLYGYLGSRAATIGGGTSEVHRSKIGENVLGLPR